MLFLTYSFMIVTLIFSLFFLASKKFSWLSSGSSTFECGFTSYFFSRFSFSMHYFLIGLVFLFLDLELSLLMPFFNEDYSNFFLMLISWFFILILIMGVILEWMMEKLDWKF